MKCVLEEFYPLPGKNKMFKVNWQYRVIAVVLALFFWYIVSGQEKVEIWLNIPVEIVNLPQDRLIKSGIVSTVRVRCRGTSTILSRLETGRLTYALDLSRVRRGENLIVLEPKNINLPRAIDVVEITPSRLELDIDFQITKTVPVSINWEAYISPDYELREIRVEPEQVRISGAASILDRIDEIGTKLVEIREETPRGIIRKVSLDLFPDIESSTGEVMVEFSFGPILEEIWVRKPVNVFADEGVEYRIDPDYIRANLALPKVLMRIPDWREQISYYIWVHKDMDPGEHEMEVMVDLPRDGEVREKRPEKITVQIK